MRAGDGLLQESSRAVHVSRLECGHAPLQCGYVDPLLVVGLQGVPDLLHDHLDALDAGVLSQVSECLLHQEVPHVGLSGFVSRGGGGGQDRSDRDQCEADDSKGKWRAHKPIVANRYEDR